MMYDARVMIRFQDLERFAAEDIDAAIERDDPHELQLVSVTVALAGPDRTAAQDVCLRLSRHAHNRVRGHAVMSLGHLARRFRALDEDVVKPVIESSLAERDEYVRTHAKSAADEICQFLGWEIKGHVYGI
jgi:hypothetical protein